VSNNGGGGGGEAVVGAEGKPVHILAVSSNGCNC
jgi:hypothetical protein